MRIVFFALCLLLSHPVRAVIVQPLSIGELVIQADLVVRGTVMSKSCQRDPSRRIYTKVDLDVSEVWKGNLQPGRLTIVHGGGILGEERVVVSGQVDYRLREDVVVFLIRNSRGEAVTLAMAQGKFTVSKGPAGTLYVSNGIHGAGSAAAAGRQRGERFSFSSLKSQVTGAKL